MDKKTSTAYVYNVGRFHDLDGVSFFMYDLYMESTGLPKDALIDLVNEDDFEAKVNAFEERWLKEHGVTHVINECDDGVEQTLEEYLASY